MLSLFAADCDDGLNTIPPNEGKVSPMVTIRLFCNAGMSTSLLVTKMRQAAEKRGLDVDIIAYSANEIERQAAGADVALLGPQIAYRKAEAQKICGALGVPVDVIPAVDYGMVNGEKVLDLALKLAGK